jgi:hypothetical protein
MLSLQTSAMPGNEIAKWLNKKAIQNDVATTGSSGICRRTWS